MPFFLVLYFLGEGYPPTKAAFFVIVATFFLSFLNRKTWMTLGLELLGLALALGTLLWTRVRRP